MFGKTKPCEFADQLFACCSDPEMFEELYPEAEVTRFLEHTGQDPPCPYCHENTARMIEFFANIEANVTVDDLLGWLKQPTTGTEGDHISPRKQLTKVSPDVALHLVAGTQQPSEKPARTLHHLDDGKVIINGEPYVFAQDDRWRIFLTGLVRAGATGLSFGEDQQPYPLRPYGGSDEPAFEVVGLTLGVLRSLKDKIPELSFVMESE